MRRASRLVVVWTLALAAGSTGPRELIEIPIDGQPVLSGESGDVVLVTSWGAVFRLDPASGTATRTFAGALRPRDPSADAPAALLDDDRLLVQPWLGGDAHLWLVLDAPAEEVMAD